MRTNDEARWCEIVWYRHWCPRKAPRLAGWRYSCLCRGVPLDGTKHRQECRCRITWSFLALAFLLGLLAVYPAWAQTATLSTDGPVIQNDIPSLYRTFENYFSVGAAIWPGDISGPHSELLKKHFNSITAENAMKWAVIEPTEGNFNFAPADALVGFAKSNHMLVRGHTL